MQNTDNNHALGVTPTGTTSSHPGLREAAMALGLKPVRAYVPDDGVPKQRSTSAERTKRAREKAEAKGFKQISVSLPVELHEKAKELSRRTRAGESAEAVWTDLTPKQPRAVLPSAAASPTSTWRSQLRVLPGWRRWLIQVLVGTAIRSE